ncbi:MAG: N-acetylmuramoyl-L-alanine amidase, partial [Bacilli bacterium]|nr:N-acetylmuramoyl-L-alanine amidase [Bacilli bacterium]
MHSIIIDIGHGIDTEGKGVPQLREFDFNQAVAKYVIELAKLNDINVILTQPFNSNAVPLSQRTKIINNSNAEL